MRAALVISPTERAALEAMRDRDPKPYRRERAAALLKIAEGQSPAAVARDGLLKPRHSSAVNRWLAAYHARGLDGLTKRPSRRAFSP